MTIQSLAFRVGLTGALGLVACQSDGAGPGYTVNFLNNSSNPGSVYMFQTNPGPDVTSVQSLAWFAEGSNPDTRVRFSWSVDYAMFWSTPDPSQPGAAVQASQLLACDLDANNAVTLHRNTFGFLFEDQMTSTTTAEGLTITQDSTIPAKTAAIGTGMSGAAVFAVAAQPNLVTRFLPTPMYSIGFSQSSVQQGQVVPVIPATQPQSIAFPLNEFTCTATLDADNAWTVSYGP